MNAQIIQQQSFLKYKELYAFLARHHTQLAEEIGQAYINTMRWYYLSNFTRYRQALEKLPLFTVDKQDALGNDPSTTSKPTQPSHDPLSLGRRIDILRRSNPNALTSYLASESKSPTYLETPFSNFCLALIDNATAEYTFLTTFFSPHPILPPNLPLLLLHLLPHLRPRHRLHEIPHRNHLRQPRPPPLRAPESARRIRAAAPQNPRRGRLHQRHEHAPLAPLPARHGRAA